MNILYQSDDNFAPFLGVSLYSLLVNNTDIPELNVYVIELRISELNKARIQSVCDQYHRQLNWISGDFLQAESLRMGMPSYNGFRKNTMSMMKVFAPNTLDVDHILYIDCDTIVPGSLTALSDLDIGGKSIGMVLDSIVPTTYKTDIGLDPEDCYYNSGIIYFNIANWKKNNCLQHIINFAKDGHVFGTVDQDYLNVVLKSQIYTLPLTFNVQCIHLFTSARTYVHLYKEIQPYYSAQEIADSTKKPAIIHYEKLASMSPWHKNTVHPSADLFETYLRQSPWSDFKKPDCTARSFILAAERIMYKVLPRNLFAYAFRLASNRMLIQSNKPNKNS